MSETKQLTLPITGMTCANCVGTVERNLKKLDGVQVASVNLSSERASVEFDPAKLGLTDLIARVERAGYGVATGEADLVIKRLDDDNDARRLENALRKLEGVLEVQVSYATEKARVQYVPTIVSQAEIRRAVAAAGFEALELGGDAEDAEAAARQAEINNQRRLLIIGVIFTVPLFLLSMGMDWGLLPPFFYASTSAVHGMPTPQPWFNWLLLALAIPVQFYVGCAVLRRRVQGRAQPLGQHGCADRAGFVGGVLLQPAHRFRLAGGARLLRNRRRDHHADQAGQVPRSARQGAHERGDQEADGPARQDRARGARRDRAGNPGG